MHLDKIIEILKLDKQRIKILEIVNELKLPQCYIGAGFLRNMIWDYTHKFNSSELNDIDIIYFDEAESDYSNSIAIEQKLKSRYPEINWEVRNQALMHIRNNDSKYKSTFDAMSYWPEKETAVGIRQIGENEYEIISVFDLSLLFSNTITFNSKRDKEIFKDRVETKHWLSIWPKLKVVY